MGKSLTSESKGESFPFPTDSQYSMEYYIKLIDHEESTTDFAEIHKYGGKLIGTTRLISELCKNLDSTAFYASSKRLCQFLTPRLWVQPQEERLRAFQHAELQRCAGIPAEQVEKRAGIPDGLLEDRGLA